MIDLRKVFARYSGGLRTYKLLYSLNNLLHAGQLRHNKPLYKRFGIHKSVFAPINSTDITRPGELPWLDALNGQTALSDNPRYLACSAQEQAYIRQWVADGYLHIKGFCSPTEVETLNAEIDRLLADGTVSYNYTGVKVMDAFHRSEVLQQMANHKEVVPLLSLLLGRQVRPFQTINFRVGSQQALHSDFIHMSTEPKGYLSAAWLALDSVTADNGPLRYVPGSHRLPYVLLPDFAHGHTRWRLKQDSYKAYEAHIEKMVAASGLETVEMRAEPGDLFIWHANLLHGGAPILNGALTRRSMVTHYLAEDVLCYHEISERPTIF